uniref:Uncharacterized protein n=1 Tax=Cacopsylla melanoneura TaxID=428564 RepID=A0A8D9FE12_9HEMI
MKKSRELVNIVKCRKLQYLGHIMRNPVRYELLQLILQGKIDSKRQPGRRRISWLANLRTWFGKSSTQFFRIAVDKVRIAMMEEDDVIQKEKVQRVREKKMHRIARQC